MQRPVPQPPALAATAERRAAGADLRRADPPEAIAHWRPRPDRPDPVAVLLAEAAGRIPDLVPERHARMATDAFAFLRGGAGIMAADLAPPPRHPDLRVQACGDAHLRNFGGYATPEGMPVFDLNDFDETLPAPFLWDLQRLAASFAVASPREDGRKAARQLARRTAQAYRTQMRELAQYAPLATRRFHVPLEQAIEDIGDRDTRRAARRDLLGEAVQASRGNYLSELVRGDRLRPPANADKVRPMGPRDRTLIAHAFAACIASLPDDRQALMGRYRLADIAFKVAGVGSVGTWCAIGLFLPTVGEPLLLQVKQANPSVLAAHAGPGAYADQGRRVVEGQRLMQAAPDLFLGWARQDVPESGLLEGRHFYLRLLKDARLAAAAEAIERALPFYARLCGRSLAAAHARSGDAAFISGYLGEDDRFDRALGEFAMEYAAQVRADYAAFAQAILDRRLPVPEAKEAKIRKHLSRQP